MTNAAALMEEFRSRAAFDAGMLCAFEPQVAGELVRRCREEGLAILGIEAFQLTASELTVGKGFQRTAQAIRPVAECSIDFTAPSTLTPLELRWASAERLLTDPRCRGLVFEIVLNESDWS